jgi:hypothetical protein
LAQQLIEAAKVSVGSQPSAAHQLGVRYACEDLETLRMRLKQLDGDIAVKLQQHEIGRLLTTIAGIGDNTAACLIAELGDPARFESAAHWPPMLASVRNITNPASVDRKVHRLPRLAIDAFARRVDANPYSRQPLQSLAAILLSAIRRAWQTAQGRTRRRHAQTVGRRLFRGQVSSRLRAVSQLHPGALKK